MRARVYITFIALLILLTLAFIASRAAKFVQLFFEHSGIAITQDEVAAAHNATIPDSRPQLIPKIIHQVYHNWHDPKNETMPADWDELRQSCITLNPGWEYKLWTERKSREFISKNYPWFLKTYDGYSFPVQRVDSVRYFLLLHYGGIYLDLDNGCLADLTPLLYYPLWVTDGGRGALSNNILASRPNHPYWTLLTNSLIPYNYNYIFPYVTISYASGQWFLTAIWQQYHAWLPTAAIVGKEGAQENQLHRLMMDDRPEAARWVYFSQARGGTWVNWDNRMFLWIGDHLFLLGLGISGLVGMAWWGIRRLCCQRGREYTKLKDREDDDV
ncbi:nucleotide-diphospho-sugar transferase [Halenospora varia]|nr:nucleotide-diphospho-sugar transferase [Halenospora varia]